MILKKKAEGMSFMLPGFIELQNSSTAKNKVTKRIGVSKIPNLQVTVADRFVDTN